MALRSRKFFQLGCYALENEARCVWVKFSKRRRRGPESNRPTRILGIVTLPLSQKAELSSRPAGARSRRILEIESRAKIVIDISDQQIEHALNCLWAWRLSMCLRAKCRSMSSRHRDHTMPVRYLECFGTFRRTESSPLRRQDFYSRPAASPSR